MSRPPIFETKKTLDAVVEHWAKARIDIPMQLLARFDEAAKQLITLATILQGLYLSIFTFGNFRETNHLIVFALLFATIFALVFCGAQAVCTVPIKKEAFGTYILFRKNEGLSDEELTGALHEWCVNMDDIADKKHVWLTRAKWILVAHGAIVFAAIMIFLILMMR